MAGMRGVGLRREQCVALGHVHTGGVCLLLPLAGWAFLASRTGDMLAALAAAGQVIAILVWALTWAFLRRDQVPKRPSSRKHHQRG